MALQAIVDSIDSIPQPLREHYAEKDGKFYLGVTPVNGYALEDVTGLKTALGKERSGREALEKASLKFKDIDPDAARDAIAKLAELSEIDPKKEADKLAQTKFDGLKTQLEGKHAGEIKAREERIAKLAKNVSSLLIDSAATAALAEAKGSVDLLLPHIRAASRVKEGDDGFSVEIVGADGNARISTAAGNTGPMTIKELIAEMKSSEAFGRAFEASGASGSGAQGGGGRSAAKPGSTDLAGPADKRRAAIANDPRWASLPAR